MNIAQIVGHTVPAGKRYSKAVALVAADPQLLYGVELEIEHTRGVDWNVPGINSKEDGSLRDGGYEYITVPMTFSNLAHCLTTFFDKSKVTADNYSERCSVHVHVNCGDLEVYQLSTILLLYQTFEKILFRFIGDGREQNIFCVPWSETTLNYGVVNSITSGKLDCVRQWQKYTAVNLLPLLTQCSIEFRHMAGTCDKQRILQWCNIIGCMFTYAREHSLEEVKAEILQLNTNSLYQLFLEKVFKQWAPPLMQPGFHLDLEDGVLQMKYSLMDVKKQPTIAAKILGAQWIDAWREDNGPVEINMQQEFNAHLEAVRQRMRAAPPPPPARLEEIRFIYDELAGLEQPMRGDVV